MLIGKQWSIAATTQTHTNNTRPRPSERRAQFQRPTPANWHRRAQRQSVPSFLLVLSVAASPTVSPHLQSCLPDPLFPSFLFSHSLLFLSLMSSPPSPTIGQVAHEKGRVKRRDRPPALAIADPTPGADGEARDEQDVANDARKVATAFPDCLPLTRCSRNAYNPRSPPSKLPRLKSRSPTLRRTCPAPPRPRLR